MCVIHHKPLKKRSNYWPTTHNVCETQVKCPAVGPILVKTAKFLKEKPPFGVKTVKFLHKIVQNY